MAPSKQPQAPFSKDERVLCFHMEMLYEAKILDIQPAEDGDGWRYKIHYKGWKSSWDDWVPADRVRKFTDENKDLAAQLLSQYKNLQSGKAAKAQGKKAVGGGVLGGGRGGAAGSDMSSARGSEERGTAAGAATQSGRGPRRVRDFDLENEDTFHSRPSVKIPVPDHLKSLLVDDWENVTKNQQLVPLPHKQPVTKILEDYLAYERPKHVEGSPSLEILEETIAGLLEYFDKCLGRILLYRFERKQYNEFHQQWAAAAEGEVTGAAATYGAEHLARLLVTMPELIAQTNMDQQSVNRLREELAKFTSWFSRHTAAYFVSEYETPSQEYVDQAKTN